MLNLQVCYLKFHAVNDHSQGIFSCQSDFRHSWLETLSSKFVFLDNFDKISLLYLILLMH